MKLLVYTHTDCKDIWKMFFNQVNKYLPRIQKIILVNKDDSDIPLEYQKIFYNENLNYTKRVAQCLEQLHNETILFIHEDMILFEDTIEKIYDRLIITEDNISTVAHMLNDNHLDFDIYGIKAYKHKISKITCNPELFHQKYSGLPFSQEFVLNTICSILFMYFKFIKLKILPDFNIFLVLSSK